MTGRLPNFLIVGAAKSGTTSLAHYLRPHPQVFMAAAKELHFFDEHYAKGLDWYREHFAGAQDATAVGEATPVYMYDAAAVARMAAALPDARLIAVLRDPVDRAYSHYWMNRRQGREPLTFADAIAAEPERLAAGPEPRSHFAYVDRSRYLGQLRRLAEHFSREQVHVVLFDDLAPATRAASYAEVCRFLDIAEDARPATLDRTFNESVAFRSLAVRRLTHRMGRAGLRRSSKLIGRLNARRTSYPPLPERDRVRVAALFEEENRALAAWLERDLASWS